MIDEFIPFYSDEYQIPGFKNYSFNFAIYKAWNEYVTFGLCTDFPKPVYLSCDYTVNSISKTITFMFEDSRSCCIKFGKKNELFVNGFMKLDIKLDFKLLSENVEVVEKKPLYAVQLLDDDVSKILLFALETKKLMSTKTL
uniref:Uncharacterized protein n=1 Tax=Panagrolaimus sp. JU765 TaxID=591449 RepID=A0AC34PX20_9BILA